MYLYFCSLCLYVNIINMWFHFVPLINLDQWYQSSLLLVVFLMHVLDAVRV
jgi:hypothetical protein